MAKPIYSIQHAAAEIFADKEQRDKYVDRLKMSRKYRLAIQKMKPTQKNVFFKPISWTSARGNEYSIRICVSSKTEGKKHRLQSVELMMFQIDNQTCAAAISVDKDGDLIKIFKHHFIRRYNERLLKKPDMDMGEVICTFLHNNTCGVMMQMESKKYNDSFAFIYPEGIGFGNFNPQQRYSVLNTFVTKDMLYKNQMEVTADMQKIIDLLSKRSLLEIELLTKLDLATKMPYRLL